MRVTILIATICVVLLLAGCKSVLEHIADSKIAFCKEPSSCNRCDGTLIMTGSCWGNECEDYRTVRDCSEFNQVCDDRDGKPRCITKGTSETFAKCLAEKGAKMYGAMATCPDTQAQKRMFGEGFKEVAYSEVSGYHGQQPITETPTWVINGQLYPGTQPFSRLAELTGCVAP